MKSKNFAIKTGQVLFVTINLAGLLLFADFLYKVFAPQPLNVDRSIALLSLMLALLLAVYGAKFCLINPRTHFSREYFIAKRFYFLGNVVLLGVIVASWHTLPWFSKKNHNKGEELYAQIKVNQALPFFIKSHHQDRNNTDAILALARIYSEDRLNDDLAKMYYERGVENKNDAYKVLNNMALWHIKNGKYDDAITRLMKAQDNLTNQVVQNDDDLAVHMGIIEKNMAWAYWKKNEPDVARRALSKAEIFLSQSGKISEYPEYYCLKSLILPVQEGRDYAFQCNKEYANWKESDLTSLDRELLQETKERYE